MGNFNRNAELASAAGTEELIWNKTGAYTLPVANERLEISSTDVKDVIGGVGARTVNIKYLDSNYVEHVEDVRLGDYATDLVVNGDMTAAVKDTDFKDFGKGTSLAIAAGVATFTPTMQYDGIEQDSTGATIPITTGKKYLARVKASAITTERQLACGFLGIVGAYQQETATVVGTITKGGKAKVTITDKNHVGTPMQILVDVAGTKQVETATITLDTDRIKTGGNATAIVTCTGMTGTPKTISIPVAGTKQVETATVVGVITLAGSAIVTVTAKGIYDTGYPFYVQVALNDDQDAVATKIRAALTADTLLNTMYTVSGATDKVILTNKLALEDDTTLNISVENGTCTGITDDTSSADTTPGVIGDTPFQVAAKIRAAFLADADIAHVATGFLTVGGTGNLVTLTAKSCVANVANLNINIADGTCDGITTAATSANTTAGVAGDTATGVATKIKAAMALYPFITDYYVITGANADIILTSKYKLANDTTLNIATANYTCTGLTAAPTSVNTTVGLADAFISNITNFDSVTAIGGGAVEMACVITATGTAETAHFAIMDIGTSGFEEITLDNIMLIELDALTYQSVPLAKLKALYTTYFAGTETTKRTLNADYFRVQSFEVTSAGSELDNAGAISLTQVTGVGTNVYAYIVAAKMRSEQLIFTVPYGRTYTLYKVLASSLLAAGGKLTKIEIKTNYDRISGVKLPVLTYVSDLKFSLKDDTISAVVNQCYTSGCDIKVVTSGDATPAINVTLIGDIA